MTCSIQNIEVLASQPDATGTPAMITASGDISSSCLQVRVKLELDGALSKFAIVENGQFTAVLERDVHYASGDIVCGITPPVTLVVDCLDGDTCQEELRIEFLDCDEPVDCDLAFASSNPVVAVPDASEPQAPAQIMISGSTQDCADIEVRFLYENGSNSLETGWKTAVVSQGVWTVTFLRFTDYTKDLACGHRIQVEVQCKDIECGIEGEFVIDCAADAECPSAQLTAELTKNCLNGRREVIFTVTLNDVTEDTDISGSIKTDDLSIGVEIEIPVDYSAATASGWEEFDSGTVSRNFSHFYLEGTYPNVRLLLVGECAGETPLSTIVDEAGISFAELNVKACDCPDVTVSQAVCRVTDATLNCDDTIPDSACTEVTEGELADEAGLAPGTYLVKAMTVPPGAASGYSWSIDGTLQDGETDDQFCIELEIGDEIDVSTAVILTPNCAPSIPVTLRAQTEDGDDNDDDDNGDGGTDNGDPGNGNDNDDIDNDDNDGCFFNWCLIWLWSTFGVAVVAGIAILITACFLFNPAGLTSAFWVGVVISVVLVLATIISLILWAIFCARLPSMCGPLVWVHDILLLLAASSFIFALILAIFSPPCGVGFILDFAYFGLLATITEITIRVIGCPFGQNGIVGLVIDIINWIGNLLGLNSGN